jgi:hypothetical protein
MLTFGLLLLLLGGATLAFSRTNALSLARPFPSQIQQHRWKRYNALWAKKSETKANADRSSTRGGFGAPKKEKDLSNKLRSVSSQHAGAGSKPLRQAALAFDRIRKELGKEACQDVYVRSPLNSATTFWFVGKVAFESGSDGVAACLSQKRLILEYSMQHLRPQNLGGKYASALELWLAPPDSEMDVAQNKVAFHKVEGSAADLADDFIVATVGYNPEIYVGDELTRGGLRVERDEQGQPSKPVFDVNQSA